MKTIVTHLGPDLDAITSVWLLKTFLPDWHEADVAFVPAGKTLNNKPPDQNSEILHVDTGFGQFDHHQTDEFICAALLVYELVKKEHGEDIALERLLAVVNDADHFQEVFYPNPDADFWEMSFVSIIDGWRLIFSNDSLKIVNMGMNVLDGVYKVFQNKLWAEREISNKGIEFKSPWGKALAIQTINDEVIRLGQKRGYKLVVRKDPKKGYLRIKSLPLKKINLEKHFQILKEKDNQATWFLHASKHMILNGSSKNPDMKPTRLTLEEIIKILKKPIR